MNQVSASSSQTPLAPIHRPRRDEWLGWPRVRSNHRPWCRDGLTIFWRLTGVKPLGRPPPIIAHDPFFVNSNNPFKKRIGAVSVGQRSTDFKAPQLLCFVEFMRDPTVHLLYFTNLL
ncbi:hypothetical protein Y032_0013g2178 [Ancylostoma ceylanicum]|uniref:Uncharacterized protein n=1 Tax=Ancylostoma ceylanicum TaxID=53326 RepID=A0A016VB78_9BILA|nr:hypothetical protein Y032_0013g2178 [Ancylostoma ceylanicum]